MNKKYSGKDIFVLVLNGLVFFGAIYLIILSFYNFFNGHIEIYLFLGWLFASFVAIFYSIKNLFSLKKKKSPS